MMRAFLTFLAAAAIAAPLTPLVAAATRAWTTVATPAAQGSYVIGNPGARVKLVEYVSYTCPHCAHFTAEAKPVLHDRMIRDGSVSLEVRNAIHDRYDLAAATLARCAGPAAFPAVHAAFFARQGEWTARAQTYDTANRDRLARLPQLAQLKAMAQGAGLTGIARDAGMTQPAITACFATPAAVERTLAAFNAVGDRITGTPTFELNGQLIERVGWAELEPQLRAAGAR